MMTKSKNKQSNQVVGNAGLYYVCYELCKRGWNVLPTSRNARGVDVVIYNQDASKTHTIQVKALSKRSPVPLGTNLGHLISEYFLICRKVMSEKPEVFVVKTSEIRNKIHRGVKDGKVSYWLQPKNYEAFNGWGELEG